MNRVEAMGNFIVRMKSSISDIKTCQRINIYKYRERVGKLNHKDQPNRLADSILLRRSQRTTWVALAINALQYKATLVRKKNKVVTMEIW